MTEKYTRTPNFTPVFCTPFLLYRPLPIYNTS